jgi:hypothetical protein
MPVYEVYVFCDGGCSEVHPMGITGLALELDDEERPEVSVGDLYAGSRVPEHIARLMDNEVRCPKTGKRFRQTDNDRVFLVRTS